MSGSNSEVTLSFQRALAQLRRLAIRNANASMPTLQKAEFGQGYGSWQEDPNWMQRWYANQSGYTLDGDGTNMYRVKVDPTDILQKATLEVGDAGAYNIFYAGAVVNGTAQKPGTYQALPKNPWKSSGWRIKSAGAKTSGIGVAQSAAVGTDAEATFREVGGDVTTAGITLKTFEVPIAVSNWMLAMTGDNLVRAEEAMKDMELSFFKALNADMNVDITTLAGDHSESIDRVTGETNLVTEGLADLGDEDGWGIDRSANSWFDAWALSNSGTDRNVSVSLINQLYQNVFPHWGGGFEGGYYITKQDTHRRWSELEESKQRFTATTYTQDASMGIGAASGVASGLKLSSWDSMPIVVDDSVAADGSGRIHLLHKEACFFGWATPPVIESTTQRLIAGHKLRAVMYGDGELIAYNPIATASLRDLA